MTNGDHKLDNRDSLPSLTETVIQTTAETTALEHELAITDEQITQRLRELGSKSSLTPEEQAIRLQLIALKKKRATPHKKEDVQPDLVRLYQEAMGTMLVDDKLKTKAVTLFEKLPLRFQSQYYQHLIKTILPEQNEVRRVTALRGALFEISRIVKVLEQGLEQISEEAPDIGITYLAFPQAPHQFVAEREKLFAQISERIQQKLNQFYSYDVEHQTWTLIPGTGLNKVKSIFDDPDMAPFIISVFTKPPQEEEKSKIQIDVPIQRDGGDYVYETKSYSRRIYGQTVSSRNQLLKYQKAITDQRIKGATVEIDGRIDGDFLKWATGIGIDSLGEIPDVEIIYSLPLPSGSEYRFVLKRSRIKGLQFKNEDRQYSKEDRSIITGIQKAILDKSILSLLSKLEAKDFDADIQPFLTNPTKIDSLEMYQRYDTQRLGRLWEKLGIKASEDRINEDNKRSAYSSFANREYVHQSLVEYQAFLRQNPQMAKIKKAYLVEDERIPLVVDKVMEMIEKIRLYEEQRRHDPEEAIRVQRRHSMGYKGKPEGVSLDIEHIIIDAIQELNKEKGKNGRSYDTPERFKTPQEVLAYLQNKESQRFVQAEIYDPLLEAQGKNPYSNNTGVKQLERLEDDLLNENLKRLEQKVHALQESGQRASAIEMHQAQITRLRQKLKQLQTEKATTIQQLQQDARVTKDFSILQKASEEFKNREMKVKHELEKVYIEIIGGQKEYEKIKKRVSKVIDQDIIKFIYAVRPDDTILMDEEVIRGDISGRAAHSELAQGRNIYGAGEMVFCRHNETFSSYDAWKKWKSELMTDTSWYLSEINNGSGHYRPVSSCLRYTKNLLHQMGIDTSRTREVDSLIRGLNLSELGIFTDS